MFRTIGVPDALTVLALRQSDTFSFAQASFLGVTREASRRLERDGHWHRVAPGIWSTRLEPVWLGHAWAGILQSHDGVLGGCAAGHLYKLCEEPSKIDVWTQAQLRRSDSRWRFRRGQRRGFNEPPRVRIEEAALEMCEQESESGVLAVLAKAVGTRRTTAQRLRRAAVTIPNLHNQRLILEVLAEIADGVESPLEHRYLVDVERAHGLPDACRQSSVSQGTRSDVSYPEFLLLIELDGQLWHEGLAAWADMERDNRHELASLTTLRFGWDAVLKSPCRVAAQVATALTQNGWTGRLRHCANCG